MGAFAFDFNDVEPLSSTRYDYDTLISGLRAHVKEWAPEVFPSAVNTGRQLRMADVYGRAPRSKNGGSCILELEGEHAGDIFDFGTNEGGNAINAIAYATGLWGKSLFDKAAEYGHLTNGKANGHAAPVIQSKKKGNTEKREIEDILAKCVPLSGSIAEKYLASRGLKNPNSPDLLFCPDCTDWKAKRGRPAIIAKLRDNDFNFVGAIHRIYLEDDGSAKASGMDNAKLTLGSHRGIPAAVQLYPPNPAGEIWIAEGIETAIAASILRGVPVWALLGVGNFLNWRPPASVTFTHILADGGGDGFKNSRALAEQLQADRLQCDVDDPQYGDDFNHDLMVRDGLAPDPAVAAATQSLAGAAQPVPPIQQPQPQIIPPGTLPPPPQVNPGDTTGQILLSRVQALQPGCDPHIAKEVIYEVVANKIGGADLGQIIAELKQKTGLSKTVIEEERKQAIKRLRSQNIKGLWQGTVATTPTDEIKPTMDNAVIIFEGEPATKGLFAYDMFAEQPMVMRCPPWEDSTIDFKPRIIKAIDVRGATSWIQRLGFTGNSKIVREAMERCADLNTFHPVRDFLDSLKWDGKPRIHNWLSYYLGARVPKWAEKLPIPFETYLSQIGEAFLISMIARVYQPGCKVDTVLTLEGPQDAGKSSVANILGHPWFSDDLATMATKEGQIQLRGVWLMELSELASVKKQEIEVIKAFITRTEDRFREIFEPRATPKPRENVFMGTTNEQTWMRDDTGGRRFYPVLVGKIDSDTLDDFRRDRDQLLAEAVVRYRNGQKWWLTDDEVIQIAKIEQASRLENDPWFDKLEPYLKTTFSTMIKIGDLLDNPLRVPIERQDRMALLRVQKILKKLGYDREAIMEGDNEIKGWTFKKAEPKPQ